MIATRSAGVVSTSVLPFFGSTRRTSSNAAGDSTKGYGDIHFLLGSRKQLEPLWKAFGIQPQSKRLEHSAHVVLADARGRQRIGFPFDQLTEERLAHDLARLD